MYVYIYIYINVIAACCNKPFWIRNNKIVLRVFGQSSSGLVPSFFSVVFLADSADICRKNDGQKYPIKYLPIFQTKTSISWKKWWIFYRMPINFVEKWWIFYWARLFSWHMAFKKCRWFFSCQQPYGIHETRLQLSLCSLVRKINRERGKVPPVLRRIFFQVRYGQKYTVMCVYYI